MSAVQWAAASVEGAAVSAAVWVAISAVQWAAASVERAALSAAVWVAVSLACAAASVAGCDVYFVDVLCCCSCCFLYLSFRFLINTKVSAWKSSNDLVVRFFSYECSHS